MTIYDKQGRTYSLEQTTARYYYALCSVSGARVQISRAAFGASGFYMGY